MGKVPNRSMLALLIVLLMAVPGLPAAGGDGHDVVPVGGPPGPLDVGPWVDEFDDASKVNTTQNTEVVGGEVRLVVGQDTGVVASVAITPPVGYRYDMLVAEVSAPGTSRVMLSVLNATEESTKVGYVNEPVPGFLKVEETHLILFGINVKRYPQLRLQADLEAGGADRPALLRWEVSFIGTDMWKDDLLSADKIEERTRINVTGGAASVDLSMRNRFSVGYDEHDNYPPLIVNRWREDRNRLEMSVFYPDAVGSGYASNEVLYAENPGDFVAGDLDDDGYVDLVVANYRNGGTYTVNSWILWGNESGKWDNTRRTFLATDSGRHPAVGDVDGDGFLDVLISCGAGASTGHVRVFLNPGHRGFSSVHDITLPGDDIVGLASGDLDGDGYSDVVLAENYQSGGNVYSRAYFGSPTGPDATADRHYITGDCDGVDVNDYNQDGFPDVAFACTVIVQPGNLERAQVFMGSEGGADEEADADLDVPASGWGLCVGSGDIDGDGYPDLVFGRVMSQARMYVFWADSQGLSNSRSSDPRIAGSMYDVEVIDVNGDGFADAVSSYSWGSEIHIYAGSSGGIDGDEDITLNTRGENAKIAVGVGPAETDYLFGTFVTKPITRPADQKWDILVLEGDIPEGTDFEVSVLATSLLPIRGYESLDSLDVDLSGIDIPSIHVRVTLKSLDMVHTPLIDSIMVKWMDLDVWREEFYGLAKVEGIQGFSVTDGELVPSPLLDGAEEIVVGNVRKDDTYTVQSLAFRDAGSLDYSTLPPFRFRVPTGAEAVEVGDFNGDGWNDVMFAIYRTSNTNYIADSPMFMGTPVGWPINPTLKLPSVGVRDVLVKDLNGDGHKDVVLAQEQNGQTHQVKSTLFWGSDTGWPMKPDVEFSTMGASGVAAADLDKDGRQDLAFACYRDDSTTGIDSMVFLQDATGFCGTAPSHLLATKGARAVEAADLDEDGWLDLVFANSLSGGFAQINSVVYWGQSGGFAPTPSNLATFGAQDVKVADIDGDGDLDVVFACGFDNGNIRLVDSFVYLLDGSRSLPGTPSASLPTVGASAVAVGDLDGTGWKDLVFACQFDGASYEVSSRVYLGGASGYGTDPDILLPTMGAGDVEIVDLLAKDMGGYMSRVIKPQDTSAAGVYHTFRYTANLPAGQTGRIYVVDADTGEVLAETVLLTGTNEWDLSDKFRIREHDAIQLIVTGKGIAPGQPSGFTLDDLWLNWTPRNMAAPQLLDIHIDGTQVLRTQTLDMVINVTDEYDYQDELTVQVEHRPAGSTTDLWASWMIANLGYRSDAHRATIAPLVAHQARLYDLRVKVVDSDGMESDWRVFTEAFEVLNNLPSAPEIRILPSPAMTTSTLEIDWLMSSIDIESTGLTYVYSWYRDGELIPNLTSYQVSSQWLTRGQNWSVEVRADDGEDLGPPGVAWRLIENAPPGRGDDLPDPVIKEDTPDSNWIVLADAFYDPDGDTLEWFVDPVPVYLDIYIDPSSGRVTITPALDWHDRERLVFWASDGVGKVNQTVWVTVEAVNDNPKFTTINGQVYTGGPVELEVDQDQELVITVGALDVEGDDLLFRINSTRVNLDSSTGRITWTPGNDDVRTWYFQLSLSDNVEPSVKAYVDFVVTVKNVNDPPRDPRIISPANDERFDWNASIGLRGLAADPDGDELTYTWRSNVSGDLGEGQSVNIRLTDSGHHNITLTISDGEYSLELWVHVNIGPKPEDIKPPKPPEDDSWLSGIFGIAVLLGVVILVLLVVLGVFLMMRARKRAIDEEAIPMPTEEEIDRHRALKELADAVKETADKMEAEKAAKGAAISVEGTGMVPSSKPSHKMRLTEQASDETARLWSDIEKEEPEVPDEEKEELRRENMKRRFQSAIQALPYGIPSPELRKIPPHLLAEELVTGTKHELPDGTQLTAIRGKWYHSDDEDSSKFLTEYKKPEVPKPEAKEAEEKGDWKSSDWEEG